MNKVDPSVYGDTSDPHRSSGVVKCCGCVSKIPTSCALTRITKHTLVEILGNIWPIDIRHVPQRPNYTAKAAKL